MRLTMRRVEKRDRELAIYIYLNVENGAVDAVCRNYRMQDMDFHLHIFRGAGLNTIPARLPHMLRESGRTERNPSAPDLALTKEGRPHPARKWMRARPGAPQNLIRNRYSTPLEHRFPGENGVKCQRLHGFARARRAHASPSTFASLRFEALLILTCNVVYVGGGRRQLHTCATLRTPHVHFVALQLR